jgi:hypothetical protein
MRRESQQVSDLHVAVGDEAEFHLIECYPTPLSPLVLSTMASFLGLSYLMFVNFDHWALPRRRTPPTIHPD